MGAAEQVPGVPRDPAIHLQKGGWKLFVSAPQHSARGRVEGKRVLLGRAEHCAADLDQACLEAAFLAGIEGAQDFQALYVRAVDLAQPRVTLGCQCIVVAGPVIRGERGLKAQSETNQGDARNVHNSTRTRTSRNHNGIHANAAIITGNSELFYAVGEPPAVLHETVEVHPHMGCLGGRAGQRDGALE